MKKKIISLCLLGLATFGGINVFAASSVSTNCSLKDWYTSGSQYHAEATTKAPSNGLKKSLYIFLQTTVIIVATTKIIQTLVIQFLLN